MQRRSELDTLICDECGRDAESENRISQQNLSDILCQRVKMCRSHRTTNKE